MKPYDRPAVLSVLFPLVSIRAELPDSSHRAFSLFNIPLSCAHAIGCVSTRNNGIIIEKCPFI